MEAFVFVFVFVFICFFPLLIKKKDYDDYNKEYKPKKKSYDEYTYEELLKTNDWHWKKSQILKRDNYRCTQCGNKNVPLQVHHKYYYKHPNGKFYYPWEYPNSCLISVCDDCHKALHKKYKTKIYVKDI